MRTFRQYLVETHGVGTISENYAMYSEIFEKLKGKTIPFKHSSGQTITGKVTDFLSEGVFVVQTQDGEEHDVDPQDIDWNTVKKMYGVSPQQSLPKGVTPAGRPTPKPSHGDFGGYGGAEPFNPGNEYGR